MIDQAEKAADARPSERELLLMARAAYQAILAWICNKQRLDPDRQGMHRAANLAYADYYQRMVDTGGKPRMIQSDVERYQKLGWSAERIGHMDAVIAEHENGQPAIKSNVLAQLLTSHGYPLSRDKLPQLGLLRVVELALFPAYRDACLAAEDIRVGREPQRLWEEPVPQQLAAPATSEPVHEYAGLTMREIAALVVSDRRESGVWDNKLCRQAASTAGLFELLIGSKAFPSYSQEDLAGFDRKLMRIPKRYDLTSARSREEVCALAETPKPPEEAGIRGLTTGTVNRHYVALRAFNAWAKAHARPFPTFDFENLNKGDRRVHRKRASDDRAATPEDDFRKLFDLPIYRGGLAHLGGTGQMVLRARFTPGTVIVHDAFYWVPLLVYYTGCRREELCKLTPSDVCLVKGIAVVEIDFTETGRIKNENSRRPLPLHDELIRLGFMAFVDECRRRDYDVLFPELKASNTSQNYGDVFYKNAWTHLKRRAGVTSDTSIHGGRHTFTTGLKNARVTLEIRREFLGHGGVGETEERYSKPGAMAMLHEDINKLPSLTDQLDMATMNLPPRAKRAPMPLKARADRRNDT